MHQDIHMEIPEHDDALGASGLVAAASSASGRLPVSGGFPAGSVWTGAVPVVWLRTVPVDRVELDVPFE